MSLLKVNQILNNSGNSDVTNVGKVLNAAANETGTINKLRTETNNFQNLTPNKFNGLSNADQVKTVQSVLRFTNDSQAAQALGESLGLGKTISNPKVFTIDNQSATVTQGEEIPYQTTSEGTTTTAFKEAALKLQVTPSIIGDGNVLLTIQVNNDTPNRTTESDEPPINKMEIVTKLLVADGDIVVIGGIKKNVIANSKSQTPGLGNVPVIGNLFKGKSKSDNLDELLVFIAPRIL